MDAEDRRTNVKRYNAGIQRARGLLELASGLYDSSLSSESWKAAEGVLQTDSPLGNALKLSLTPKRNDRKGIALSFTTGGFRAIRAVAEGKFSLAWVNPSVQLTMAYRGKGPFPKRLPERCPLKVSIRNMDKAVRKEDSTMFTVAEVLRAGGFTLEDIRRWGGEIHLASRPSHPARRADIESGRINAIFDEGIKSWARTALENGFRFLPVEGSILKHMTMLGYRPTCMPKSRFEGMAGDIQTLDFSGWPMIVRADMPDDVAYALCETIEKRKDMMPTDNYRPLDIAQLCANDEESPYDVPLHPGAARFYRERGYLK